MNLVLPIINSIIGAGIFGLPSEIFALSRVYNLLAFAAYAVVVYLLLKTKWTKSHDFLLVAGAGVVLYV